jgi:superfamily II DNA or RNA helicase
METVASRVKTRVQAEAITAWNNNGRWGAIVGATGIGKSKMGVDIVSDVLRKNPEAKELIVVPTAKLRDDNWPSEFEKWGVEVPDGTLKLSCYASLPNIRGHEISVAIMDEGHNMTESNMPFFENNRIEALLWLSAVRPRDDDKKKMFSKLRIFPVYEITLDEAVKLGLVAPYEITIIEMELDKNDKYLTGGKKTNPFKQTELGKYQYLSRLCIARPDKHNFIDRMRFLHNVRSRTVAAINILEHVIPKDKRTLIFCASKKQAIEVNDRRFFSKPVLPKLKSNSAFEQEKFANKLKDFEYINSHYEGDKGYLDFLNKNINRLACVDALNEGQNIDDLDCAFIVATDSNPLNLWQRIGRIIRFRVGHTGRIILLCIKGTEDIKWIDRAIAQLDSSKITRIGLDDLRLKKETISFD